MKIDEEILGNSVVEKYLGDIIHEKGCKESITTTIKEIMRKIPSKCEEIIRIAITSLKLSRTGGRGANLTHSFFQRLSRPNGFT